MFATLAAKLLLLLAPKPRIRRVSDHTRLLRPACECGRPATLLATRAGFCQRRVTCDQCALFVSWRAVWRLDAAAPAHVFSGDQPPAAEPDWYRTPYWWTPPVVSSSRLVPSPDNIVVL